MKKSHWIIEVPAWGTVYAFTTEKLAEDFRVHKANYEKSVARKRKATTEEINSHTWKDLN